MLLSPPTGVFFVVILSAAKDLLLYRNRNPSLRAAHHEIQNHPPPSVP